MMIAKIHVDLLKFTIIKPETFICAIKVAHRFPSHLEIRKPRLYTMIDL